MAIQATLVLCISCIFILVDLLYQNNRHSLECSKLLFSLRLLSYIDYNFLEFLLFFLN